MRDKLRRSPLRVKQATTISCGRSQEEHKILRKYSHLHGVNAHIWMSLRDRFSAAVPPHFRQFSTVFPQDFAQREDAKSSAFRPVLHSNCICFELQFSSAMAWRFSSAFSSSFPNATSRLGRWKKGEKQAESKNCGKASPGRGYLPLVVVAERDAHKMWHVEQ